MKRLLYSGLMALMALFAMPGVARADEPAETTEPTVTITLNPASGAEVNPGTPVNITVEIVPADKYHRTGDIDYVLAASRAEAESITRLYLNGTAYQEDNKPVIIEGSTVLKLEFRVNGPEGYNQLFTEYAEYTIAQGEIATPVIKVNGEPYSTENSDIKKEDKIQITVDGDAEIWYTTDGTEPAKNQGTQYTAEFSLTESATVKAIAVNGEGKTSVVVSAPFFVIPSLEVVLVDTARNPIGDTYGKYVNFLSMVMDGEKLGSDLAMIFYTIDGETEPSKEAYYEQSEEGPIYRAVYGRDSYIGMMHYPYIMLTDDTVTFKALGMAILNGKEFYTEKISKKLTALPLANPELSVEAGAVDSGTVVKIKNIDEFTTVYYTLNGDAPAYPNSYEGGEEVLRYDDEAGIVIEKAVTLRVIGYKETGEGKDRKVAGSDMVEAAYTIAEGGNKPTTGNEYGELAGVNVCPNPNNGTFHVTVPERARIDIFGLNGAMVMSREANAGVEVFNIDHSGIYFVRVMAGNKTVVKRVVVR